MLNESEQIKSAIDKEVENVIKRTERACFRLYKAVVIETPNPHTKKAGIRLVASETTINIPYSFYVKNCQAGDLVWVAVLYDNFNTAVVWKKIDFKDEILDRLALEDGTYDNMTVGNAKYVKGTNEKISFDNLTRKILYEGNLISGNSVTLSDLSKYSFLKILVVFPLTEMCVIMNLFNYNPTRFTAQTEDNAGIYAGTISRFSNTITYNNAGFYSNNLIFTDRTGNANYSIKEITGYSFKGETL